MVCRLTWHAIGLEARFAGARCTRDSTLRSATVSGMIWTSLSGVRVGDPVAKMRWQVPSAKLVSSRGYRKTLAACNRDRLALETARRERALGAHHAP
jgi:hypothetical protein